MCGAVKIVNRDLPGNMLFTSVSPGIAQLGFKIKVRRNSGAGVCLPNRDIKKLDLVFKFGIELFQRLN